MLDQHSEPREAQLLREETLLVSALEAKHREDLLKRPG